VVLAAVSIGAFAKRGEDARRVGSARNLQQWGIALNLFLMDHNNQLPEVGKAPVKPEQKNAWFNALPPYISKPSLADIPPGERPRPGVPSLWIDPSTRPVRSWDPEVFYFNYGMNAALQPDPSSRSFRIFEIPYPGNVVFMAEKDGYSPEVTPSSVAFRHGGVKPQSPRATAHVLFCDGHVQAVPRSVLVEDPAALKASSAAEGLSWFME
ncbi:MAG: hypothetical protein N2322_08065, partial [Terrimicrobiaceae bacterium]|nr:hypothetical protein [Terrimicrobiaceae bacterium]